MNFVLKYFFPYCCIRRLPNVFQHNRFLGGESDPLYNAFWFVTFLKHANKKYSSSIMHILA